MVVLSKMNTQQVRQNQTQQYYRRFLRREWVGRASRIFFFILACALMAYVVFPFAWLLLSSFKTRVELFSKPPTWIPQSLYLKNFNVVLHDASVMNSIRNSIVVAVFTTLISLVIGSLGAYAFVRFRFPHKNMFFVSILATQMLPSIILLIPLFVILRYLQLLYTHFGLILTYTAFTLPYVIWLLRAFFVSIPMELADAARVDGCTRLQTFFKIILPLSAPGFISTGIFAFIGAWNEFLFASILTNVDTKTFPVRLALFIGEERIAYEFMFPAAIIGTLPVLLLVFIFQRHIVKGLTEGGVKF